MADLIKDMIQEILNNNVYNCPICGERVTAAAGCAYYHNKTYDNVSAVYHMQCLKDEYGVELPIYILNPGGTV